jgi:hypothetical protein
MGRPGLPPGRYFRLLLGSFEGLDSERGMAWRFGGLSLDAGAPDHSTISRTRRLIDVETQVTALGTVTAPERAASALVITAGEKGEGHLIRFDHDLIGAVDPLHPGRAVAESRVDAHRLQIRRLEDVRVGREDQGGHHGHHLVQVVSHGGRELSTRGRGPDGGSEAEHFSALAGSRLPRPEAGGWSIAPAYPALRRAGRKLGARKQRPYHA